MTTTDTDALRERLAETLHYGQGYDDWGVANDDEREEALALADEVLSTIAVEVRKAKAEARDEGQEAGYRNAEAKRPYDEMWTGEEPILIDNPHRRQKAVMSDDEYEAISEAEWKALATTEITHLTDEEKDYLPSAWDEWIARVRRDAAREALDGVVDDVRADWHRSHHWVTQLIEEYRDTHYPEETP